MEGGGASVWRDTHFGEGGIDPGGNPVSYLHYFKLNENKDFLNLRNTIETIVYFTCHRQALYGSVQISYHSILVLREPLPLS